MSPVRVGFVPTPRATTSEPGSAAAAHRKNAAEEMSPGTSTSPPVSVPGEIETSRPSTRSGAPMRRSMRSV